MKTDLFDFDLPPERIATHPVSPRDASKLLVVRPDGMEDRMVRDLADLMNPGDLMVFNDTKVIPARLTGKRGEAKIEVTLIKYLGGDGWQAFARPGKRIRENDIVRFNNDYSFTVKRKYEDGSIGLEWNEENWLDCLKLYGSMPLPPYMKRKAEAADSESYQTIYAQKEGAVAAPTAGLHFTQNLMESIDKKGIKRAQVTLHVGAGTFLPIKAEDTDSHVMHKEYIEVTSSLADEVNKTHEQGGRVIAVGTTSLRAIESAADEAGQVKSITGETGIFITPGYRFKAVDMLLTNFHLPKSTLFVLVSAFSGLEKMKAAYRHAIEHHYRFYSYGDACLLLR